MNPPLQKTKLFLPTPRPQLVARPRLLERLKAAEAAGCRIVLVSAPAGSGKTTVVAQWLRQLAWPVGWLALDGRDNLPARFFSYLIAALQPAVPDAGQEALALLALPNVNLEEVVTLLANSLADASGPFVLALDDFHTITNPALQQALDLFLDAQPPQMRLVLLSRQDPALQLARRRVHGQMVELRQDDLRFSLPEAAAFLNQSMGLQLSVEQTQALEVRTEGWIAGLQLAALSLQRALDVDQFIREFSGSNRFILDFLMEEVLTHQSTEVQTFLLETSILERMSADLCAFVTEKTGSEAQTLLEQTAKANLFVIPLDEERHWYRYHHLFADLLLARLQEEDPQRTARLYQRAGRWMEAHGDPRMAVEYALKAQDERWAADLIEQHMSERWQTVDFEFHLLLDRLPAAVLVERPGLCLQKAWLGVITGQTERIPALIEAAELGLQTAPRTPQTTALLAFARILRAYLDDFQNVPVNIDPTLDVAFDAIPEDNPGMRNSVAVVLGTINYMEGYFEIARRYFEDALTRDKRVRGTNAVPIAAMRMTWVLRAQGELRQAARLLREHIEYVRENGSRRFYINGALNLEWGEILLEWNDLEAAENQIRAGLHLLEDWPIPPVLCLGWSLLARLQTAQGDLVGASASLEKARTLQRTRFHPCFMDAFVQAQVGWWIAAADWSALVEWASANVRLASQGPHFRFEAGQIELARAWLALGNMEAAASLLEKLLAEAGQRDGRRMSILTLLVAARADQPDQAFADLEEALLLGEPEGYLRTWFEAGQRVRLRLKAWLLSGRVEDQSALGAYARRVLDGWEEPARGTSAVVSLIARTSTQPAALLEPLSEREREVLYWVAQGLTNQQIAVRLVISIRTVKKHVENIHGKLGVQNRTQAVAQARRLGLLDD